MHLAQFNEVESLLAPFEDAARAAAENRARRYALLRLRALLRRSAASDELDVLLAELDGWHDTDAWKALVSTHHAWSALYERRPHDAIELLEEFGDAGGVPIAQTVDIITVRYFSYARLALTEECLACWTRIDEITSAFDPAPWELKYAQIMFLAGARVLAGDRLAELRDTLLATRATSVRSGDESMRIAATKLLGLTAMRRGHLDEAVEHLDVAADGLEIADPANVRIVVLSALARSLAGQGDVDRAEEVLADGDETITHRAGSVQRLGSDIELARAYVVAASGRRADATHLFIQVAVEEGNERPAIAIEALHAAVRFGRDPQSVATDIRALAERVHGRFLPLLANEVCALADGDADALWSAMQAYDELGLDLHAAEAAARSARLFGAAGRSESERRAGVAARRSASRAQGAQLALVEGRSGHEPLTPREEEVALLVLQGRSNREIAERLVLSVRTVETLVLRACRKHGVSNRRELAAAIRP